MKLEVTAEGNPPVNTLMVATRFALGQRLQGRTEGRLPIGEDWIATLSAVPGEDLWTVRVERADGEGCDGLE